MRAQVRGFVTPRVYSALHGHAEEADAELRVAGEEHGGQHGGATPPEDEHEGAEELRCESLDGGGHEPVSSRRV